MMSVYKSLQSYLAVPEDRSAEPKGISSILSEVALESKQRSSSTSSTSRQSLRRTLSADMSSQGWMARENPLRKTCSFYELSCNSDSESDSFSDSEDEDRNEEDEHDVFSMTDGDEKEEEDTDKVRSDLWSLIQSDTQHQHKDSDSSFFALIPAINKEIKADSSQWEPCKPYVHPAKRKSTLSDQSLQLCTESLGCESGTDCSYQSFCVFDDNCSSSSEDNSSVFEEEEEEKEIVLQIPAENCKFPDNVTGSVQEKEIKFTRSFPPPLSSIARSDGPCIHVRSYKQDGRLLLKAVPIESSQKYLRAHREDGRLKLQLIHTEIQQCSVEEEKLNAHNSRAEEQQQLQLKNSVFSNLSNLGLQLKNSVISEFQYLSSNKEHFLHLNSNCNAKLNASLFVNDPEVKGSSGSNSQEMSSFSKASLAIAAVSNAYTGFKDMPQKRPSQSLITSPSLLNYQPRSRYCAGRNFEAKESAHSFPKLPCNEGFRRCKLEPLWSIRWAAPYRIAIS